MNTHKGGGHSICLLPFPVPSERERGCVGISGGADVKCSTFLSSVHPRAASGPKANGWDGDGGRAGIAGGERGEQWIIFDRAGVQCIRHSSHMGGRTDVGVASDTIPQSEFMQL